MSIDSKILESTLAAGISLSEAELVSIRQALEQQQQQQNNSSSNGFQNQNQNQQEDSSSSYSTNNNNNANFNSSSGCVVHANNNNANNISSSGGFTVGDGITDTTIRKMVAEEITVAAPSFTAARNLPEFWRWGALNSMRRKMIERIEESKMKLDEIEKKETEIAAAAAATAEEEEEKKKKKKTTTTTKKKNKEQQQENDDDDDDNNDKTNFIDASSQNKNNNKNKNNNSKNQNENTNDNNIDDDNIDDDNDNNDDDTEKNTKKLKRWLQRDIKRLQSDFADADLVKWIPNVSLPIPTKTTSTPAKKKKSSETKNNNIDEPQFKVTKVLSVMPCVEFRTHAVVVAETEVKYRLKGSLPVVEYLLRPNTAGPRALKKKAKQQQQIQMQKENENNENNNNKGVVIVEKDSSLNLDASDNNNDNDDNNDVEERKQEEQEEKQKEQEEIKDPRYYEYQIEAAIVWRTMHFARHDGDLKGSYEIQSASVRSFECFCGDTGKAIAFAGFEQQQQDNNNYNSECSTDSASATTTTNLNKEEEENNNKKTEEKEAIFISSTSSSSSSSPKSFWHGHLECYTRPTLHFLFCWILWQNNPQLREVVQQYLLQVSTASKRKNEKEKKTSTTTTTGTAKTKTTTTATTSRRRKRSETNNNNSENETEPLLDLTEQFENEDKPFKAIEIFSSSSSSSQKQKQKQQPEEEQQEEETALEFLQKKIKPNLLLTMFDHIPNFVILGMGANVLGNYLAELFPFADIHIAELEKSVIASNILNEEFIIPPTQVLKSTMKQRQDEMKKTENVNEIQGYQFSHVGDVADLLNVEKFVGVNDDDADANAGNNDPNNNEQKQKQKQQEENLLSDSSSSSSSSSSSLPEKDISFIFLDCFDPIAVNMDHSRKVIAACHSRLRPGGWFAVNTHMALLHLKSGNPELQPFVEVFKGENAVQVIQIAGYQQVIVVCHKREFEEEQEEKGKKDDDNKNISVGFDDDDDAAKNKNNSSSSSTTTKNNNNNNINNNNNNNIYIPSGIREFRAISRIISSCPSIVFHHYEKDHQQQKEEEEEGNQNQNQNQRRGNPIISLKTRTINVPEYLVSSSSSSKQKNVQQVEKEKEEERKKIFPVPPENYKVLCRLKNRIDNPCNCLLCCCGFVDASILCESTALIVSTTKNKNNNNNNTDQQQQQQDDEANVATQVSARRWVTR